MSVVINLHTANSSDVRDESNFRLMIHPDKKASLNLLFATNIVTVKNFGSSPCVSFRVTIALPHHVNPAAPTCLIPECQHKPCRENSSAPV